MLLLAGLGVAEQFDEFPYRRFDLGLGVAGQPAVLDSGDDVAFDESLRAGIDEES
ncbi:hypothetical protein [Nocardia beijingensis]|uniref:hypothetical protein n=1 Tax=Nocardia beijingensis TaxID=95162 RepID=UPI000A4007ED|nr:hypothetical protein [Nocardia beijingensis]